MDAGTISEAQNVVEVAPHPAIAPPKRVTTTAPGLLLDVGRLENLWDEELGIFTTQQKDGDDDKEKKPGDGYAFSVARSFRPLPNQAIPMVVTDIEIRSSYVINVAKVIMKEARTLSWSASPLAFRLEFLLGYFSDFEAYHENLEASTSQDRESTLTLEHLAFFLQFFRTEFSTELDEYRKLVDQGLIKWEYVMSILVPGKTILHVETRYGHPTLAAGRVVGASMPIDLSAFDLQCEYLLRNEKRIGLGEWTPSISKFEGTKKITDLNVFPIEYHPQRKDVERTLLERGLKWFRLGGIQHKYYDGLAMRVELGDNSSTFEVKSRIVLDMERYASYVDPPITLPEILRTVTGEIRPFDDELYDPSIQPPDDVLMLISTFLYGFSLVDKKWLLFGVDYIQDIQWEDAAFEHLALPTAQKELIMSLVESHSRQHESAAIDDFIEGKGLGLILSLFGPPGVGKTLTAEVTSEHTRRPLYIVGADEIGSDAGALELNMPKIFALASAWKAVVLLDEAEVFLEQRSVGDLARNALVAVLLRQLEYFPGILFLTTNREVVFDKALQSRIHIAIHYSGLSPDAKRTVWKSFLTRMGQAEWPESTIRRLISYDLNGRQIKNVVNTANVLAREAKEELSVAHIERVILLNERNTSDPMHLHAKKRESRIDSLLLGVVVLIPPILVSALLYDPILSSLWRTGP